MKPACGCHDPRTVPSVTESLSSSTDVEAAVETRELQSTVGEVRSSRSHFHKVFFFTLNIPAARGSNPAHQSVHSNFNMTKSYLLSNILTLHEIKGNK